MYLLRDMSMARDVPLILVHDDFHVHDHKLGHLLWVTQAVERSPPKNCS